ncbi:DUF3971 domain-containing protein [Palleronia sp. LCG004]|uniref:YhdP family protein n=1 Tax=Palleronia sp. LCG004 TaxID=3079304 RepID=UPI002942AF03|nr:AsmA-like C-terminal region-containing protein [Palleronia sp. LCG004]WOI55159.1 DUF3971 domain-containing protein [Palleronia sp. LCG004]
MRASARRRRGWLGHAHAGAWTLVLGFVAAVLAGVAIFGSGEERIVLPADLGRRIETRLDEATPNVDIDLGQISVGLAEGFVPLLRIERLRFRLPGGQTVAQLAETELALDPLAAIRGRLAPRSLDIAGATITLRRDAEGVFELAFGGGGRRFEGGIGGLLAAIDEGLATAPLDRITRVTLERASVTVEDARSARIWQLSGARILARRRSPGLGLSVSADIFNGTDALGRIAADIRTGGPGRDTVAQVELDGIRSDDIALQSPALAFLGVLEAPLSGSLRAEVSGDGALGDLAGTFEIGAGTVATRAGAEPIEFDRAKAYFGFDPDRSRLNFDEISVRGALGQGRVSGHAYLSEIGTDGFPRALLGQLTIEEVAFDAPEIFADPVRIDSGQLDMRLRVDPLSIEIGALDLPALGGAGRDLTLSGRAAPEAGGWTVSVDGEAGAVGIERLLELWPLPVAPNARRWLDENVLAGTAENAVLALRHRPDFDKPQLNLTFGFRDAKVRVMNGLPPVTNGAGIGSLVDHRLAILVEEGEMVAPDRGTLRMAGTTFTIPDGRIKPNPAEIDIRADGPLGALLAILDRPPMSLLSRGGRDADLASGRIEGRARIDLVLQPGNRPEDIDIEADATIHDLSSERIVEGRNLRADRMEVAFEDYRLSGEGRATLDGVGFDGSWAQQLVGDDRGHGSVEGEIEVSPDALGAFGVSLPEGFLSGRGTARMDLTLAPDVPPRMELTSDLVGLGLSIPAVAWSKAVERAAEFDLAMTLGSPPRIDTLSLDAPGLDARGRVRLAPGPRFEALELDRVRLGGWLDGAVTLRSRGEGASPAISVSGGEIDIRRAELGGGGGNGGAHGPIELRLDRLRVTDTLALDDFAGEIAAGRGLSGQFRGGVNGGAPISGTLSQSANGPKIQVTSRDAGAVLRDAGFFENVTGGALDLTLRPAEGQGVYDGEVAVTGPRLRNAPAMAKLLSAISGVGLVEQLRGQGIPFDEVTADFRLSPGRITLYRSSAVGNALGLSMDGLFDPETKRMDMQGVVSPIYVLNRVGAGLTRPGEGLFGVNFTLRGAVSDPQVGVNPLSILTPGMFRDIFRRPAPTRAEN